VSDYAEKNLSTINTPAYFAAVEVTKTKSFVTLKSGLEMFRNECLIIFAKKEKKLEPSFLTCNELTILRTNQNLSLPALVAQWKNTQLINLRLKVRFLPLAP